MPAKEMTIEQKMQIVKDNWNDPILLATFLLEECQTIVRCNKALYLYNGKCFDLLSDADLEIMYRDFCVEFGVTKAWKLKGLVLSSFWSDSSIRTIDKMNDYTDLLCLNNGIINIDTREFIPHSDKYYFDSYIAIDYDKSQEDCPVFREYLNNTFSGDDSTITNIIRLGGYLLDTSCAAEKMFLFDGSGANGKSVLINTFQLFFSEDQISPLSLDTLASTSFSKELLLKSRVNFCAEQKKAYLDSEEIKKIITGDKMEITRKFQISLTFTPKLKIISASNGLPKFNDTTHAIYRRILIIKFKNQYLNETEYAKVKHPETSRVFLKDKTLFDRIKKEKTAIFNLFLDGLVDLRGNNYEFIESGDALEAMLDFKRDSDTVREFLEDNYEVGEEGEYTSLRQIYDHYREWYRYNVQDGSSMKFRKNEMGKRVKDIFGVDSVGQKYIQNPESGSLIRETCYPIRLIPMPTIPVEEVLTPQQATQQGINF